MSRTQIVPDNDLQFVIDTHRGGVNDPSGTTCPNGVSYSSVASGWVLALTGGQGQAPQSVTLSTGQFPAAIEDAGEKEYNLSIDEPAKSQLTLRVIDDDHLALIHYFLTCSSQIVKSGVAGSIGYGIWRGWRHPRYLTQFCTGVSVKPGPVQTGLLSYQYALITLYFEAKPISGSFPLSFGINPSATSYVPTIEYETDLQPSGDVITVPATDDAPGYTVSGVATGESETVFLPTMRYSIRVKNAITMPTANAANLANTLNQTPLPVQMGPNFSQFPITPIQIFYVCPEYALFEGISDIHHRISPIGTYIYDYEFTWLISPINQNYVFNSSLIVGGAPGNESTLSGPVTASNPTGPTTAGSGSPIMISYSQANVFNSGSNPTNWPFVRPDQQKYNLADHAGALTMIGSLDLFAIFAPLGS